MVGALSDTSREVATDQVLGKLFDAGYSFALWKLPDASTCFVVGSEKVKLISEVNLEEGASGFIFSPFQPNREKVFVPADIFLTLEKGQIKNEKGKLPDDLKKDAATSTATDETRYYTLSKEGHERTGSDTFKKLVEVCISEINKGTFEKIVPSRTKLVELTKAASLSGLFYRMCDTYPHAMVSLFSSPETGTWMGASPEILVKTTADQHFHTVAVAGTQPYHEGTGLRSVTWTQKDIEEQALVERYVISCFKKIRLREYEERGPKTAVAGNVLHLKTEFEVDMAATYFPLLGSVMLKLLHPTSAVCGMPLDASLNFLMAHENYDRQYYSGFLGPVRIENESHIYVNIRCMQLFQKDAVLYAGARVMSDSDPEKEWVETEMKMNTLLRIIRQ